MLGQNTTQGEKGTLIQLTIPGHIAETQCQELKNVCDTLSRERNKYVQIPLPAFSPFTQFMTPCLGSGAALSGLGVLTSMNNAILHSYVHRPTQCKQSLIETIFPHGYELCQVDD